MLVKLIRCQVSDKNRERFSQGQRRWSALADATGFLAQFGGWAPASEGTEALVVGVWRDLVSYRQFMDQLHDQIFEGGVQKGSYDASEVTLWEVEHVIKTPRSTQPSDAATLERGVERANFVRMARCLVHRHRCEHFEATQRDLWNPGMGGCAGMLGGLFLRSVASGEPLTSEPVGYLVLSMWSDVDAHDQYAATVFPSLKPRSDTAIDCVDIVGYRVDVEAEWRVLSS